MQQQSTQSIDWALCLELSNQNAELAREILTLFSQELPTYREAMQTAYQNENSQQLYELTHKLHGACCYCGVPQLKNIVAELESTLKNNGTIDKLMVRFLQESDQVMTEFQQMNFITNANEK